MEINDWPDKMVYEWLHKNNAVVVLAYGNARGPDGCISQVSIKSPFSDATITGRGPLIRGCIEYVSYGIIEAQQKAKDMGD